MRCFPALITLVSLSRPQVLKWKPPSPFSSPLPTAGHPQSRSFGSRCLTTLLPSPAVRVCSAKAAALRGCFYSAPLQRSKVLTPLALRHRNACNPATRFFLFATNFFPFLLQGRAGARLSTGAKPQFLRHGLHPSSREDASCQAPALSSRPRHVHPSRYSSDSTSFSIHHPC